MKNKISIFTVLFLSSVAALAQRGDGRGNSGDNLDWVKFAAIGLVIGLIVGFLLGKNQKK